MSSQPTGSRVTLDAMIVDRIEPGVITLREPASASLTVKVHAYARVKKWQSVEVVGTISASSTESSQRVLTNARVFAYTDAKGRIWPIVPKALDPAAAWPWKVDVTADAETAPEIESEPTPMALTAPEGTVASAKLLDDDDPVTLEDKIVIGVYDADGVSPSFIYIGEPNRCPGIKVIPDNQGVVATLKPGDIVDVSGNVVASSSTVAECYIDGSVEKISEGSLPAPLGMPNRSTAGGEFGLQQALYLQTPGSSPAVGSGLNPVGLLARVYGRIQLIELVDDHVVYWIDDGSNLARTVIENSNPALRTGLKVVAWADSATPVRYDDDYISLAGVVGAEFSEDNPALPVPVVRVGRKHVRHIIRVKGDGGDDSYDGDSWALPKATVQGAIDAALEDDEIWIARRTGSPYCYQRGEDDYVAEMKNGVSLYGGFCGNETGRWQRSPGNYETKLDGELEDRVVYMEDVPVTCRIDSLTIQRGQGAIPDPMGCGGGGISCIASSLVVTRDVISFNNAYLGSGAGISCGTSPCIMLWNVITENGKDEDCDGGAGVFLYQSPVYMAHNIITGNIGAEKGGGVLASFSAVTIRENDITDNSARFEGGGVCLLSSRGLVFDNHIWDNGYPAGMMQLGTFHGGGLYAESCTRMRVLENLIEDNYAYEQGGGMVLLYGSVDVVGNTFSGNSTAGVGGALMYGGPTSGSVTGNAFSSNSAGQAGGAIDCGGTGLNITRNTFTGNNGGDRGGAISITNATACNIINNLFVGNHVTGTGGGAIYAFSVWPNNTSVNVVNNTFVENQASSEDPILGRGGAVLARALDETSSTSVSLINNILYNNTARAGNSAACLYPATLTVAYSGAFSDVNGNAGYHYLGCTPGTGCITQKIETSDLPIFGANYHLAVPAPWYTPLDHGCDAYYGLVPAIDLDGNGRPVDISSVNNGLAGCCDMGAFETQSE